MNEISEPQRFEDDCVEEVAIIGLSGRFPGAAGVDEFWRNLANGVESVSSYGQAELETFGHSPEMLSQPNFVPRAAALDGIDLFDARFFKFSPQEAALTDPQHRLFLECAWEAFENAGYDPARCDFPIGVFAGANPNDYVHQVLSQRQVAGGAGAYQALIGNEKDFLCTRVSHKLDLRGPSMTVQTGCSTSLVAVQLACQSLLAYQCSMALAGGVSVNLRYRQGYLYEEGMILSPDGVCRAFDEQAAGTVLGEGVGIVVLRRLADALQDGDTIHAVVKSAAVNNDGAAKVGYTAPSVDGQAEVIVMAHALGQLDADTIDYVETHGTGTPLGDPIEIEALTQAFRTTTERKQFCAIGSVKTNVGHLDAAAGITGLIKTVLSLQRGKIPPSLNFSKPNANIDFQNSPFYVNTKLTDWDAGDHPRRAGVSSFGIGGTNCHVILEEAPQTASAPAQRSHQLLLVSASSEKGLERAAGNLAEHLRQSPESNLADISYTLQVGRRALKHRRAVVCADVREAAASLADTDHHAVLHGQPEPRSRHLVFMFPGQGAQYRGMTRGLYASENVFRRHFDYCCDYLQQFLDADLRELIHSAGDDTESNPLDTLDLTSFTQPALFTVEYALARLWMHWGVRPTSLLGHSVGEYVAACLAGVISLEDSLQLVATRGKLMQQLPAGSMLSVRLSEDAIQHRLSPKLSIAAVNGPLAIVISGPDRALQELADQLLQDGIHTQPLRTSHAFHSAMMDPMIDAFSDALAKITLSPAQLPILSTVTGKWITSEDMTSVDYWINNLRQPIRFSDCMRELQATPDQLLLEVGPGRTLTSLAKRHFPPGESTITLSSTRHATDSSDDGEFLLKTVGSLWLAGVDLDWDQFQADERRQRVPLPTHPFQRERHWIEASHSNRAAPRANATSENELPNFKNDFDDWFYAPEWQEKRLPKDRRELTGTAQHWLIFGEGTAFTTELVDQLTEQGQVVTVATAAAAYSESSDRCFEINPAQQNDYERLLQRLSAVETKVTKIVHLWRVPGNDAGETMLESLEATQNLGLYSLQYLAQALAANHFAGETELEIVTSQVHCITGNEKLLPEKATILGACKVIGLEFPNVSCRNMDVLASEVSDPISRSRLIEQLLNEMATHPLDQIVAYRDGGRFVESVRRVQLPVGQESRPPLKSGGTYMIVGGLGGIGLALAEYLAQSVKARLVLVGRSSFPARDQWDQLLRQSCESERQVETIKSLLRIESMGGKVTVASADITDIHAMRHVVEQARELYGHIDGVIHSAGVVDNSGAIQLRTRAATENMLACKVQGTLVLEKVLEDAPPDFLFLFSSMATVLYNNRFGQLSYVAANSFLDAFANDRSKGSRYRTLTLNWDDWQDVGMSVRAAQQFSATYGYDGQLFDPLDSFTPSEGQQVFERILHSSLPRVLVSTRDLELRIHLDQFAQSPFLAAAEQIRLKKNTSLPSCGQGDSRTAPQNAVEQTLAEIWQSVLGLSCVSVRDNFFDLGGDSLIAVQLFQEIEKHYGKRVQLATLVEAPTIRKLGRVLAADRQPTTRSTVVEIKPEGSLPPLFCMHAADGNVLIYRDLARHLGPDQPLLGVQSAALVGESIGRLSELAQRYVQDIRRVQANGPYMLAGYCMGGTVALEVAQQLSREGEKVALLALLETYNWIHTRIVHQSLLDRIVYYSQKLGFHVRNLLSLDARDKSRFIAEKLKVAKDRRALWYELLRSKLGKGHAESSGPILTPAQLWKQHDAAAFEYEPALYPGNITHIRAQREYRLFAGPELEAAGGVEIRHLPVYPAAMLVEPFVARLARELETCIAAALKDEAVVARR